MGREEKTRLATEYEAATSTFSEAVKELHRKSVPLRKRNTGGLSEVRAGEVGP